MIDPQSELNLISAPADEPVSLTEGKVWLRIDPTQTDDDNDVNLLIKAAREHAQDFCRRSFLVGEKWQYSLDHFPFAVLGEAFYSTAPLGDFFDTADLYLFNRGTSIVEQFAIKIPMGQATGVDSIAYVDPTGSSQTLEPATYQLVSDSATSRIYPAYETCWPNTRNYPGSVKVNFTAGVDPPARLKLYIRQTLAHWYANREAVVMASGIVPQEVLMNGEKLLWPLRNLTI